MKRILSILAAIAATITMGAQNIAVVSPNNSTTICQTLDEAITKAASGSTIYLPGGGFQIKNETQIDRKVTIMGVSHRGDTDNVDGATVISGNLNFVKGSSGSAVVGLYLSGNVYIGTAEDSVLNLTIKYCNINSVQVNHYQSSGLIVNQSYIRSNSSFGNSNATITNCVTAFIGDVNGGKIEYNIVLGSAQYRSGYLTYNVGMRGINASNIIGNIFATTIKYDNGSYGVHVAPSDCIGNHNYGANWGDDPITINVGISELFKNWNNGAISPSSNFHLKDEYKAEYEKIVGIYGGSSFSDETSLAPIPRIVSKTVDDQSDATGRLKVTVTVKSK